MKSYQYPNYPCLGYHNGPRGNIGHIEMEQYWAVCPNQGDQYLPGSRSSTDWTEDTGPVDRPTHPHGVNMYSMTATERCFTALGDFADVEYHYFEETAILICLCWLNFWFRCNFADVTMKLIHCQSWSSKTREISIIQTILVPLRRKPTTSFIVGPVGWLFP